MDNNSYKLIDNVSAVYRHLLPEFFNQPFSKENLAICDPCILMADKTKIDIPDIQGSIQEYCIFHPDVKCCTYEPDLPNFLVGAILSSNNIELTEGQKRINQKIEQDTGVTPQSIRATKDSTREYSQLIDQTSGCYSDIGCPYFDKSCNSCSIWLFRQANCSTFFCKSVEGIAGQQFWAAMNYYLSNVEKELSLYAAYTIESSSGTDLWTQDKIGFYIEAYHIIKELNGDDFHKICNSSLSNSLEQVRKNYLKATRTTVPAKLRINPILEFDKISNSIYRYDTGYGRCLLSERLHSILHYFNGSLDNEHVLDTIEKEANILVPPKMLLRLYKNRILLPELDTES